MTPEEMKKAFKDAIKEWMDEQATKLGWRVIGLATTGVIGLLAWLILFQNGFIKLSSH